MAEISHFAEQINIYITGLLVSSNGQRAAQKTPTSKKAKSKFMKVKYKSKLKVLSK